MTAQNGKPKFWPLALLFSGAVAVMAWLTYLAERDLKRDQKEREENERKWLARQDEYAQRRREAWNNAPHQQVWLVRHGEDEYKTEDRLRLTDQGVLQSVMAGVLLRDLMGDRTPLVLCSPEARAMFTADLICRVLGVPEAVEMDFLGFDVSTVDIRMGVQMIAQTSQDRFIIMVTHADHIDLLVNPDDKNIHNCQIVPHQVVMI